MTPLKSISSSTSPSPSSLMAHHASPDVIDNMWAMIMCMSQTFAPEHEPRCRSAFTSMIESCISLVPNNGVAIQMRNFWKLHPITRDMKRAAALFQWSIDMNRHVASHTDRPVPTVQSLNDKYHISNIYKNTWGNACWNVMHGFAANFNPNDVTREAFRTLMHSMLYLIPCKMCRVHFRQNLANLPLDDFVSSRDMLFVWTYLLHNEVNLATDRYRTIGLKAPQSSYPTLDEVRLTWNM